MSTFKNTAGYRQTIARDGIEYNVADGETVEIPDDDTSFDGRPGWSKSSAKSPDVTVDPEPATEPAPATPSGPTN